VSRQAAAVGRLTAGGGSGKCANTTADGRLASAGGGSSQSASCRSRTTLSPTGQAAAAGRVTAGGHPGAGHVPVSSLFRNHVVKDGHRLGDGDHLRYGRVPGSMESDEEASRQHRIQAFHIFPK